MLHRILSPAIRIFDREEYFREAQVAVEGTFDQKGRTVNQTDRKSRANY
ncbi:MAG TPA: hypothetical protein VGG04_01770 [Candidatus Sulfotelmatobacter sp.]